MIQFKNVNYTYENQRNECLTDINFEINPGETVLLTGLSGCGKSTVLKCINGLIPNLYEGKLTGEITLQGVNINQMPINQINKTVGSVFQNPRSQFFTTNTTSELAFTMENYGIPHSEMQQKMTALSEKFGLEKIMDRNIFQISSGERQRLSLATSFSLEPKVILFDEPSSNLDYGMTMQLREYIRKWKKEGYTILIADHRFYYLENILDKVILLENGKISGIYTEAEFKKSNYPFRNFSLFEADYPFIEYPAGETCLKVKGLSFKHILRAVHFEAAKGEVIAVIGSNGSGKTTLAKLISGMEKADSGTIEKDSVIFVMQDSDYQLFGTSVEHEIHISPHPVSQEQVQQVLESVQLRHLRRRHPFALSGGEKQRLQIATAVVSDAQLVIYDEPTSGLDFNSMANITDLIKKTSSKQAVLVISHDYEFIRKIAGRILYLNNGTVEDDFPLNQNTVSKLNAIFHKMKGDYLI